MFSKYLRSTLTLISLILVVLSQVACDRFLKGRSAEETKDDQIVNVNTDEVNCIREAPEGLENFFNDKGDPRNLTETVACVQKSLKTFMRLTKGSVPDGYLAKEVQFFFNRYLLKENKISEDFLKEIMKVKVVAVGGTTDVVTKLELEQFSQFLGEFEKELRKVHGLVRLAAFKGDRAHYQPEQLAEVRTRLNSLGAFILANTKLTSSRYQWRDFVGFLNELNHFMGSSRVLDELLKWMPVAESVKLVFIGENAKLVSDSDWEFSQKWVVGTYSTLLRFYYEIKRSEFETPQEWTNLLSWLDEAIEKVENSPAMKDRKILEARALDRLIDEVFKLELFETVLTPDLVKSTYRKALVHFVEASAVRGDPLSIGGLTEAHVRVLKQEYNVWKLSQAFLNEAYAENPNQTLHTLRDRVKKFRTENRLQVTALEREEVQRSWMDFQGLLNARPGVSYSEKSKMLISYNSEDMPMPYVGMNMANSIRSYVRFILRGYGSRQSQFNFDNHLSRQKLIELQADFQEVGVAINFIDPRSTNSASRTFDQGDLLTYHSNGDDWLNSTELYELLSIMISGGRTQLKEIYSDLAGKTAAGHPCLREKKDIFGRPFVNEHCFYEFLKKKHGTYFDHLPGAVYFMRSLSEQQWAQYYNGLLAVSISKEHVKGQLESSEIRTMTTVVNFIEAIMRIYDKDKNLVLSEEEVVESLPRFQRFLIKQSPIGDWMVEDILLFLVYEGHKPTATELIAFKAKRMFGLGDATKLDLMKLLAILKSSSKDVALSNRQ